ncbi:MAG: hypothetical protein WD077_06195 [Bacteroidia bacterium]
MKKLLTVKIALFAALLLMSSCKKVEPPEYTISGTILKAPDQPVPLPKLQWEVVALDPGASRTFGKRSESLGFFTPDLHGNFSFTYEQTKVDGREATIEFWSDGPGYFKVREIPVNQDVKDTFYTRGPFWGTLRIYLKPLKPLNGDTLFFGYGVEKGFDIVLEVDTILTEFEGLWGEMRFPPPQKTLHYGRGFKEFYYDDLYNQLRRSKQVNAQVEGDPIVNEVTIEY